MEHGYLSKSSDGLILRKRDIGVGASSVVGGEGGHVRSGILSGGGYGTRR